MKRQISIVLAVMILLLLVAPVSAGGATQISGIGLWPEAGECNHPEGLGSVMAVKLTGDLQGCFYVFPEYSACRPSGTYMETGYDIFVGEYEGNTGTFTTTYRFTAKFEDCTTMAVEVFGRCQHAIVAGSGTGDFEGVTGRLAIKDDVDEFGFPYQLPYRGHLKW